MGKLNPVISFLIFLTKEFSNYLSSFLMLIFMPILHERVRDKEIFDIFSFSDFG